MLRFSLVVSILVTIAAATFSGRATTSFSTMPIERDAENAPDRFLAVSPDGDETSEPEPGEGCRSPMVDPRDGTRLTLERSGSDLGDYSAGSGRYGLRSGELLRIECSTGRPVGIVAR